MGAESVSGAIIAGQNKGGQLVIRGVFKTQIMLVQPVTGIKSLFSKPTDITDQIESCEIYDSSSETKKGGLGKTLASGYLFGMAGAVATAHGKTKNEWIVKVILKDGHKMLVKCTNSNVKDKLLSVGFAESEDF